MFLYIVSAQHTMKPRQYTILLGLLSLVAILFIAPGITSNTATAQSSKTYNCTASNPCYHICGDHVCSANELYQYKQKSGQPSNPPSPGTDVAVPGTSEGTILAGKMAFMDEASDGTQVLVRTSHPISGQPLSVAIGFIDTTGNFVQHQNYAITVAQDGNTVLSNSTAHTHTGTDTFTTTALTSSSPVKIDVTLNGVGLPTADPSTWTGAKGETIDFASVTDVQQAPTNMQVNMTANMTMSGTTQNAVPEFGQVSSIVLAIAVLSIVVFTVKTRVFPKL